MANNGFLTLGDKDIVTVIQEETADKAPLANPALTGTATLNSKTIATTDQIPSTDNLATKDELSQKASLSGAAFTGAVTVQAPSENANPATKQYVDTSITDLNVSQYATTSTMNSALANKADTSALSSLMPKSGGTFTGAVQVQEPTEGANPATKTYVDSAVASVYKYKGSVANQAALPQSDQVVGDVYNVEDTGDNYAWDGTQWDKLAGTVDLSGYLTTSAASSTYLTKTDAQSTYQPVGSYATTTDLAAKADLASPALTGTPTVNGENVAIASDLEDYVPKAGDIDATTYNQKNYALSGSYYTITKDSPDVLYLELTGDFTISCVGAVDTNRTIKLQVHKAASVASTATITWQGVTEWLTDGNNAPVFGQVASQEQNLVVAVCLSNTVILGNTLYNSENPVTGGAITIANVTGLQDVLDTKADDSDVNAKINLTGSRGQLAGYENCSVVTSLTVSDTTPDSTYYDSTSAITVNDGTAGMSWTKVVMFGQAPSSVELGTNWSWVGGSAPSYAANGVLVLTWQNAHGLANFLSPSA